jgi:hypothetical protein
MRAPNGSRRPAGPTSPRATRREAVIDGIRGGRFGHDHEAARCARIRLEDDAGNTIGMVLTISGGLEM